MNSTLPVMKLMACLLAAVLLPAPAHAGETASSPSIEGLSDSKELTTPVVVTGVAVGGDGRPAKSGTLVTLHAWPSEYVMSSLAPGDAVKVVPVGYATTDVDGRFSLRFSNPGGVERAASRDGLVNLEIVSEAEGLVSSHSLVGVSPRIASASPLDRRAASEGVHATGGGSLLSVPHVKLAPLPGAVSGVPKGGVSKAVCSTNFVSDLGLANVRVGEFYTIDGAEGRFTYLAGNTSTLGVGASASGAKGSFTAGGTATITGTAEQGFKWIKSGRYYAYTKFKYGKFVTQCFSQGLLVSKRYYARPNGYAGGSTHTTPASEPRATYCLLHEPGTRFTGKWGRAATFNTGVRSSAIVGVDLQATTGFSSTAASYYVFTKRRMLCGSNDYEGGQPRRLVVKLP